MFDTCGDKTLICLSVFRGDNSNLEYILKSDFHKHYDYLSEK